MLKIFLQYNFVAPLVNTASRRSFQDYLIYTNVYVWLSNVNSFDLFSHSSTTLLILLLQSLFCPPAQHGVELIDGSGVYVTLPRLEEALREAKNGSQLARKLMEAIWDRETLARSSPSSKSKYRQLDPNVTNTIIGMPMLCAGRVGLFLDAEFKQCCAISVIIAF